jgi:hypothetical protein
MNRFSTAVAAASLSFALSASAQVITSNGHPVTSNGTPVTISGPAPRAKPPPALDAIALQKQKVEEARAALAKVLPESRGRERSRNSVRKALDAASALEAALLAGKALELTNEGYAAYAKEASAQLAEATAELMVSKQITVFVATAGVPAKRGRALLKKAEAERSQRKRAMYWVDSRAHFKICEEDGSRLVRLMPQMAKARMYLAGEETLPAEVVEECRDTAKALSRKLGGAAVARRGVAAR